MRNTALSTLILFFINFQDSEVSKMVCIAIVARLDLAERMQEVAVISRKSVLLFSFCKHFDEFREIDVT